MAITRLPQRFLVPGAPRAVEDLVSVLESKKAYRLKEKLRERLLRQRSARARIAAGPRASVEAAGGGRVDVVGELLQALRDLKGAPSRPHAGQGGLNRISVVAPGGPGAEARGASLAAAREVARDDRAIPSIVRQYRAILKEAVKNLDDATSDAARNRIIVARRAMADMDQQLAKLLPGGDPMRVPTSAVAEIAGDRLSAPTTWIQRQGRPTPIAAGEREAIVRDALAPEDIIEKLPPRTPVTAQIEEFVEGADEVAGEKGRLSGLQYDRPQSDKARTKSGSLWYDVKEWDRKYPGSKIPDEEKAAFQARVQQAGFPKAPQPPRSRDTLPPLVGAGPPEEIDGLKRILSDLEVKMEDLEADLRKYHPGAEPDDLLLRRDMLDDAIQETLDQLEEISPDWEQGKLLGPEVIPPEESRRLRLEDQRRGQQSFEREPRVSRATALNDRDRIDQALYREVPPRAVRRLAPEALPPRVFLDLGFGRYRHQVTGKATPLRHLGGGL